MGLYSVWVIVTKKDSVQEFTPCPLESNGKPH